MNALTVEGCAMTYAQRAEHMRAWFKRWRREFRVAGLPRLAPIQLGTLAEVIRWRVTVAHLAQVNAWDALRAHARASGDERLAELVADCHCADAEVEHREGAIRMLERAELDYLRGAFWPGGEDRNQMLPPECDRLHEWFRE